MRVLHSVLIFTSLLQHSLGLSIHPLPFPTSFETFSYQVSTAPTVLNVGPSIGKRFYQGLYSEKHASASQHWHLLVASWLGWPFTPNSLLHAGTCWACWGLVHPVTTTISALLFVLQLISDKCQLREYFQRISLDIGMNFSEIQVLSTLQATPPPFHTFI